MSSKDSQREIRNAVGQVLGYLNFSSGTSDPQFLTAINEIFGQRAPAAKIPVWKEVYSFLNSELESQAGKSGPMEDATQARAVLELVFKHSIPAYEAFHKDLLQHQDFGQLFGPLMIGRMCEAVLQEGGPWDESERIVNGALQRLNDYLGYRPIPVFESHRIEPHLNEKCRPVPLFISGTGVAYGRYQEVTEQTLAILNSTDGSILDQACFDPKRLTELAYDPRAYDFDHPANKRPNHHFGMWDPHIIDNAGYYRRFVIQQITLDALLSRVDEVPEVPREQLMYEAASVMAGTILMAAGISGRGPDTYDSSVTLGNLLPRIASFRDEFYIRLLADLGGEHRKRLEAEAIRLRQPFGGARQHLNGKLAHHRAAQLERVELAQVFARMGHPKSAAKLITEVQTPAARFGCQIDSSLTNATTQIQAGQLEQANASLSKAYNHIECGIGCGAIVDPWNILGFDGNFSLFPAMENTVHDHRVDYLVLVIEDLLTCYTRLLSASAAAGKKELSDEISVRFESVATWWNQFAAHELGSIAIEPPIDTFHSAKNVAEVIRLWHQSGAEAGNIGFWAPHVDAFSTTRAYEHVIETLLARKDFVASMALMMHWLSRADEVSLIESESGFGRYAIGWLRSVLRLAGKETAGNQGDKDGDNAHWQLTQKFFDYLEANAGDYWSVPTFALGGDTEASMDIDEEPEETEEAEDDDLFSAAYEGVVYRDSTDDGLDASVYDTDTVSEDELDQTSREIIDRLAILQLFAGMWRTTALISRCAANESLRESTVGWAKRSAELIDDLVRLMETVQRYKLPEPMGDLNSMIEYDRLRIAKESILERSISCYVEIAEARILLLAALDFDVVSLIAEDEKTEAKHASDFVRCLLQSEDGKHVQWQRLLNSWKEQSVLYVPVARGGNPKAIAAVRLRQRLMCLMLDWLPHFGLVAEACELLDLACKLERRSSVGPNAVTEFDDLFEIGYRSIVATYIKSTKPDETGKLVQALESLAEALLPVWLSHSRTLRLTVLERVRESNDFEDVVQFIKNYGDQLFTQTFLHPGNLRGILYQGVDEWLEQMREDPGAEAVGLLDDLDSGAIEEEHAIECLTIIFEIVVENYGEYRDYNSTTTQSDRGSLLYTLIDFLRLRSDYDRVAWNLRPIMLTHDMLARFQRDEAAEMWRQSLSRRMDEEADQFVKRLEALQTKYAMRLPTIADRIFERFQRPLVVARMRSLIKPAMSPKKTAGSKAAFEALEIEATEMLEEPTGIGLDVPAWLNSLEDEVDDVREAQENFDRDEFLEMISPSASLLLESMVEQIAAWRDRDEEFEE